MKVFGYFLIFQGNEAMIYKPMWVDFVDIRKGYYQENELEGS
jgi:hypothetical protein